MNVIIRSFARRTQGAQKINWKPSLDIEEYLNNKEFLTSIGIKSFPIDDSYKPNDLFFIQDQEGKYLGNQSLADAKKLAEGQALDLLLLQTDPPLLKLENFKRLVLKKVRIAQSKNIRKNIKEEFREISIRNTIKSHDLDLKLSRIENFIRTYDKIIIKIPADIQSKIEYDRAKILSKDVQNYFISKFPDGECEIDKEDDGISILFSPSMERDRTIEAISGNKELYAEAGMKNEYKKIKAKLRRYKNTYDPEAEQKKKAEEEYLNRKNEEEEEEVEE